MSAKTYTPRESEIERRWYVVDATDETLGRLATRIAHVLEGKHKPTYAAHMDTGDHVIVLNAAKITVTSDKLESKVYARHSGYPGGFKEETLGHLLARLFELSQAVAADYEAFQQLAGPGAGQQTAEQW